MWCAPSFPRAVERRRRQPRGHAVTSLSRNDFTVYEDGVKQPISQFEPTNAPFSLVLLLDMSGSTMNFRPQLKQARHAFSMRWRPKIEWR